MGQFPFNLKKQYSTFSDLAKSTIEQNSDNLVFVPAGKKSVELALKVKDVLESDFYFKGIDIIEPSDKSSRPFSDNEVGFGLSKDIIEQNGRVEEGRFFNKHVVAMDYLKVFNNKLRRTSDNLTRKLGELNTFLTANAKEIPEWYSLDLGDKLKELAIESEKLERYSHSNGKSAAKFTSTSANPSGREKRLKGAIRGIQIGKPEYIAVAVPKSIYEWSHNMAKNFDREDNPKLEMDGLGDFLNGIKERGADSFILLHPHAPKEGLNICDSVPLSYVGVFPQSYTFTTNGSPIDVIKAFGGFNLKKENYDCIDHLIENLVDALPGEDKKIKHLLIFGSGPDAGSINNAKNVCGRQGLYCVTSSAERFGEATKKKLNVEPLEKYLHELKDTGKTEADITILILDDKMSSGGTTNEDALYRKKEIERFNKENNTNYKARVEVVLTHVRTADSSLIKNPVDIDRITAFDTCQYYPSLQESLSPEAWNKFNLLEKTHYQMALGIALDFVLQKVHSRHAPSYGMFSKYRKGTELDLVKCYKLTNKDRYENIFMNGN